MIYLITNRENNCAKIGCADLPKKRLNELQTATHCRLVLEAVIKGNIKDEHALHKKFSKFHILNEWFILSDAIVNYFEKKGRRFEPHLETPRQAVDATRFGSNIFGATDFPADFSVDRLYLSAAKTAEYNRLSDFSKSVLRYIYTVCDLKSGCVHILVSHFPTQTSSTLKKCLDQLMWASFIQVTFHQKYYWVNFNKLLKAEVRNLPMPESYVFTIGRHKGKTVKDIAGTDVQYVRWYARTIYKDEHPSVMHNQHV